MVAWNRHSNKVQVPNMQKHTTDMLTCTHEQTNEPTLTFVPTRWDGGIGSGG